MLCRCTIGTGLHNFHFDELWFSTVVSIYYIEKFFWCEVETILMYGYKDKYLQIVVKDYSDLVN